MSDEANVRNIILGELIDYSPKDSTDMMQSPFFSLSKRKRLKPIDFTSADGKVTIKVTANPAYGMATIWDADIIVWAISKIVASRNNGANELSSIVRTTPSELLLGIGRSTGGANYKELMAAITRLRHTQVETSIRAGRRKYAAFHYLGDLEGVGDAEGGDLNTLVLRVPDWLLEGIEQGKYVTIDKEYYGLTGGVERAIYRTARKHAGSNPDGWTCRVSLLHQKTGSDSNIRTFAFKLRQIVAEDDLPRYAMKAVKTQKNEEAVHFIDRSLLGSAEAAALAADRLRRHRDQGRTAWIDAGLHPRQFDSAWAAWIDKGLPSNEFGESCTRRQSRLV